MHGRNPMIGQLLHQESYTAQELADLLDRPVELVTDAVFDGRLKAVVADGKIVEIARQAVLDWLSQEPE